MNVTKNDGHQKTRSDKARLFSSFQLPNIVHKRCRSVILVTLKLIRDQKKCAYQVLMTITYRKSSTI